MKHLALFLFAGAIAAAQPVTMTLSSATAAAGGTAYLNVQLNTVSGAAPASLEWAINAPAPEVQSVRASLGPAAVAGSKMLCCSANRCVLAGLNSSGIANGTVAVLAIQLSPSAQGNLQIQFSYAKAASAKAVNLMVGTANSVLAIRSSTTMARYPSPCGIDNAGGNGDWSPGLPLSPFERSEAKQRSRTRRTTSSSAAPKKSQKLLRSPRRASPSRSAKPTQDLALRYEVWSYLPQDAASYKNNTQQSNEIIRKQNGDAGPLGY